MTSSETRTAETTKTSSGEAGTRCVLNLGGLLMAADSRALLPAVPPSSDRPPPRFYLFVSHAGVSERVPLSYVTSSPPICP